MKVSAVPVGEEWEGGFHCGQITSSSCGGLHFHSLLGLQGISVPSGQDDRSERYV